MLVVITIVGSLCTVLFICIWIFGNWKVSLTRLSDSYIYGREKENLSAKEAFLKTLRLRYRLKKTSELSKELEEQGLNDKQINHKVNMLLLFNSFRQGIEYRYGAILVAKGFFEEATDLKMSRSLLEGEMRAGEDTEESVLWEPYYRGIRNNDYGLLQLLVCGLAIEYYAARKKSYDNIVSMIKTYFNGRSYYQKYLDEPQIVTDTIECNPKQIFDDYLKVLDKRKAAKDK
jgi:hypothetical protein